VRDPAGPGDAGRRPFDASPRLQLVPAGVHHTNTETERPKSNTTAALCGLFGSLPDAGLLQEVSKPTCRISAEPMGFHKGACGSELRDCSAQATA
jgi:hypothetical protein